MQIALFSNLTTRGKDRKSSSGKSAEEGLGNGQIGTRKRLRTHGKRSSEEWKEQLWGGSTQAVACCSCVSSTWQDTRLMTSVLGVGRNGQSLDRRDEERGHWLDGNKGRREEVLRRSWGGL